MSYTLNAVTAHPFPRALEDTRAALAAKGFGILWEIDVKATMEKKLGKGDEYGQYVILGACNPEIAHRAFQTEYPLGVLLPCNVVVYETPGADTVTIAAVDPKAMLAVTGNPALEQAASQVYDLLKEVVDGLGA